MAIDELKRQMVFLLTDYLKGANGTDRKPALYISVRVIKYMPDKLALFIDSQKRDRLQKISPYHPNTQADNQDLGGPGLLIKEGTYCHYPDEIQQELGLYPWADQMNGPWVVVLSLGMMTHFTMAFCM